VATFETAFAGVCTDWIRRLAEVQWARRADFASCPVTVVGVGSFGEVPSGRRVAHYSTQLQHA
jgi:hypothetical protein